MTQSARKRRSSRVDVRPFLRSTCGGVRRPWSLAVRRHQIEPTLAAMNRALQIQAGVLHLFWYGGSACREFPVRTAAESRTLAAGGMRLCDRLESCQVMADRGPA